MREFRDPTPKDIIEGVLAFLKIMLKGILTFDIDTVRFAAIMIRVTLAGGFEVCDDRDE